MAFANDGQLNEFRGNNVVEITPENIRQYLQVLERDSKNPTFNIVGNNNTLILGNVLNASGEEVSQLVSKDPSLHNAVETADFLSDDSDSKDILEDEIVEELQRQPSCSEKVIKALNHLTVIAVDFPFARFDLVKMIFDVMERCSLELDVHRASFQSLIQLIENFKVEHNDVQLNMICEKVLDAVERFPRDKRLFQNCLEILNYREMRKMFRSREINCGRCCKIVMDGLCDFQGDGIEKTCLLFVGCLLQRKSSNDLLMLAEDYVYRKRLFTIVNQKCEENQCDDVLKLSLDICSHLAYFLIVRYWIIQEDRLSLLHLVLEKFLNIRVRRRALQIIEYTARLDDSIQDIKRPNFLRKLLEFVNSDDTEVSYLSSTILLRILDKVEDKGFTEKVLQTIKCAIEKWESPSEQLIRLESLLPFCRWLTRSEYQVVQLYAAWSLCHVCSVVNSKYYIKLLYSEKLIDILDDFCNDPESSKDVINHICNVFYLIGHRNHLEGTQSTLASSKVRFSEIFDVLRLLEDPSIPENMVKDLLNLVTHFINKGQKISMENVVSVIYAIGEKFVTSDLVVKALLSCYLAIIPHLNPKKNNAEFVKILRNSLSCVASWFQDEIVQDLAFEIVINAVLREFNEFDSINWTLHCLKVMFTFDTESFNEKCLKVIAILTCKMNEPAMDEIGINTSYRHKLYGIVKDIRITGKSTSSDIFVILRNLSQGELMKDYFYREDLHLILIDILNQLVDNVDIVNIILEILINVCTKSDVNCTSDLKCLIRLILCQNFSVSFRAISLAIVLLHSTRNWLATGGEQTPCLKTQLDNELPSVLLKWRNKPKKAVPILLPTWFLCNYLLNSSRPYCQFYAAWVLDCMCSVNATKYSKLLYDTGDFVEIRTLNEDVSVNWYSDEKYNPNSLTLHLKDDVVKMMSSIWKTYNANVFPEPYDVSICEMKLKESYLETAVKQSYIRAIGLAAESRGINQTSVEMVLKIFCRNCFSRGLRRECIAFFFQVSKHCPEFMSDSVKIEIARQIFNLRGWHMRSSIQFGYDFLRTWIFPRFEDKVLIIKFLINNFSKLSGMNRTHCPGFINSLMPSAPVTEIDDWKQELISVAPLFKMLEIVVMDMSNLLVICCFRLMRYINFWSIRCLYPTDIDTVISRITDAFYFDSEILFEGISLLTSVSKLGIYKHYLPRSTIDYALKLVDHEKFEISFCAVACLVQISFDTDSDQFFYPDFKLIDVIVKWQRPNMFKYNLHNMCGYLALEYLSNLLNSTKLQCTIFSLWIMRQLYTSNNELTVEGKLVYRKLIDIFYENYQLKYEDEIVDSLVMDIRVVLRSRMN